jgi:hypothetical protein
MTPCKLQLEFKNFFKDKSPSLATHKSGPRDELRCGALSKLKKAAILQGDSAEIAPTLNVELWDSVVTGGGGGGGVLPVF